jgi:hypothetical protein
MHERGLEMRSHRALAENLMFRVSVQLGKATGFVAHSATALDLCRKV